MIARVNVKVNLTKKAIICIAPILFLQLAGCGSVSEKNVIDAGAHEAVALFLDGEKYSFRKNEKYNQGIYNFYSNQSYDENVNSLMEALGDDWVKQDDSTTSDGVTMGVDVFLNKENDNVVISIGQTTTTDLNKNHKYIVTLVVGENLEKRKTDQN